MKQGNWPIIKSKIEKEDRIIFQDIDKSTLNDYDKRRIIFNYLCENMEYDYLLLIDILLRLAKSKDDIDNYLRDTNITNPNLIRYVHYRYENKEYRRKRNPIDELLNAINNHTGVCNSISQYYKLLLEHNGIYSVCVICDNMLPINHQVTLVYNQDTDTYSFDDVTTAIMSRGVREKCFDYDLETAKEINQGKRSVGYLTNVKLDEYSGFGVILRTEAINYYVGRTDESYLQYGLEKNGNMKLPDNIISNKRRRGEDDENTYRYKKSWEDRGL